MIDPKNVCLYIPAELHEFKRRLFERIGNHIAEQGGSFIHADAKSLDRLPLHIAPIVGAAPYLFPLVDKWSKEGRPWIGWDRGYIRRKFGSSLPHGLDGGYYRWTINRYQMGHVRDVSDDRWRGLIPGNTEDARPLHVKPWQRNGKHIVLAIMPPTYRVSHWGAQDWDQTTYEFLRKITRRKIVVRKKDSRTPLEKDLKGAHCLVTHGSIAAVEAVIHGVPVFVSEYSAAKFVGLTDLSQIENPVYPDRQPWLNSLAYSQWNEKELIDGTLWRMIE